MVEALKQRLSHMGDAMCGLLCNQRPATRKYVVAKRALYCALQSVNGGSSWTFGTRERREQLHPYSDGCIQPLELAGTVGIKGPKGGSWGTLLICVPRPVRVPTHFEE